MLNFDRYHRVEATYGPGFVSDCNGCGRIPGDIRDDTVVPECLSLLSPSGHFDDGHMLRLICNNHKALVATESKHSRIL